MDTPEYALLIKLFTKMGGIDLHIANIIIAYIYKDIETMKNGVLYKYRTKFGKIEGDFYGYRNKTLVYHEKYKEGKLNGQCKKYYEQSGCLENARNYENDELNGTYIEYYDRTGQIKSEATYWRGMRHGHYKEWYKSDTNHMQYMQYHIEYSYGKYNGDFCEWKRNGMKSCHLQYRMGMLHGKQIKYYINPKNSIYNTEEYTYGRIDGKRIEYSEDEKECIISNYRLGKLIGNFIHKINGKVMAEYRPDRFESNWWSFRQLLSNS
jgi:antitoxin component YwqK of YwqJK toxin-antitoxin module